MILPVGGFLKISKWYDTVLSQAFILFYDTNMIFVCIVSFDSDEVETSSLSVKCYTYSTFS